MVGRARVFFFMGGGDWENNFYKKSCKKLITIKKFKIDNFPSIFWKESFKMNWTQKKKGQHKIEIAFKFTKQIPLKFIRNKKMISEIMPRKYATTTVTFWTIFEKSRRNIVILKIIGATSQLDQNINPQDTCLDNFFVYISIYGYSI